MVMKMAISGAIKAEVSFADGVIGEWAYVKSSEFSNGVLKVIIAVPKKTVVKEAYAIEGTDATVTFTIPTNAKNVKCTYEVEE